MSGYDALAEVYEWLISDAKLAPAEFAASFDDVLSLLPPNAQVEAELHRVGLRIEMSTFNPEAENYLVVASKV